MIIDCEHRPISPRETLRRYGKHAFEALTLECSQ